MKTPRKPLTPKKRKGGRRLDDSGFSEESPKDKKIYNRSYKINPTRGKPKKKSEMTPDALMFKRSRKMPRNT